MEGLLWRERVIPEQVLGRWTSSLWALSLILGSPSGSGGRKLAALGASCSWETGRWPGNNQGRAAWTQAGRSSALGVLERRAGARERPQSPCPHQPRRRAATHWGR